MAIPVLTLTPLAIKYADMVIMAAIHKAYQNADSMTEAELATEIARLEERAEGEGGHDAWIEEKLAKAREEGR